ncbi:unnamed protein product, partial [Trichogramma brassicae]
VTEKLENLILYEQSDDALSVKSELSSEVAAITAGIADNKPEESSSATEELTEIDLTATSSATNEIDSSETQTSSVQQPEEQQTSLDLFSVPPPTTTDFFSSSAQSYPAASFQPQQQQQPAAVDPFSFVQQSQQAPQETTNDRTETSSIPSANVDPRPTPQSIWSTTEQQSHSAVLNPVYGAPIHQSVPTFYNPNQFAQTQQPSFQSGISSTDGQQRTAAPATPNYFQPASIQDSFNVRPEPTGSATLSPVQMSANPLTATRSSSSNQHHQLPVETVPPSLENLAEGDRRYRAQEMEYRAVYHHWFYRREVEAKTLWLPFSMHDSLNLDEVHNSNEIGPETKVATDGGRYDVEILRRQRSPVYWTGPVTEVRRCSWFYKGAAESRYTPYEENVAARLEDEYKQAHQANHWNRRVELNNGEYIVFHSPSVMVHYQQATTPDMAASWGNNASSEDGTYLQGSTVRPRVVKRGMDEFNVDDGEPEKIDHLLFLVHGIGSVCDLKFRTVEEVGKCLGVHDSLFSFYFFSIFNDLSLSCAAVDEFRSVSLQLVQSHYRSSSEQGVVNRIEVLPISWHATLHSGIDKKLQMITLESIPKLRHFTNDTLLDILFYTSPIYCETIMQTVGSEMNRLYDLFRSRNPEFQGSVYLGGHSLGSLIMFDLLCHQKPTDDEEDEEQQQQPQQGVNGQSTADGHKDTDDNTQETSVATKSTRTKKLSKKVSYVMGNAGTGQPFINYPQLQFKPQAFFALGSPIGMFVTVRGIDNLGEDFTLPTCPAFFNIFHPFDPVAYRVESLINPEAHKYRPMLIPHHKGRKRMHLELKETMARVGADLKQKLIDSVRSTWNSVYQLAMFHRQDNRTLLEQEIEKVVEEQLSNPPPESMHHGDDAGADVKIGKLNGGRRIDYVLQEAPFEYINEYIFALTSHVCYWESEDTMLLILKEIYGSMGIQTDAQLPQQSLSIERVSTPTLPTSPAGSSLATSPTTVAAPSATPYGGIDPTAPMSAKPVGPPPRVGFVRKSTIPHGENQQLYYGSIAIGYSIMKRNIIPIRHEQIGIDFAELQKLSDDFYACRRAGHVEVRFDGLLVNGIRFILVVNSKQVVDQLRIQDRLRTADQEMQRCGAAQPRVAVFVDFGLVSIAAQRHEFDDFLSHGEKPGVQDRQNLLMKSLPARRKTKDHAQTRKHPPLLKVMISLQHARDEVTVEAVNVVQASASARVRAKNDLDHDGHMDFDKLLKKLPAVESFADHGAAMVAACRHITGANPCESAFKIMQCWQSTYPDIKAKSLRHSFFTTFMNCFLVPNHNPFLSKYLLALIACEIFTMFLDCRPAAHSSKIGRSRPRAISGDNITESDRQKKTITLIMAQKESRCIRSWIYDRRQREKLSLLLFGRQNLKKPVHECSFSATAVREIVKQSSSSLALLPERILSRTPSSSSSDVVRPRRNDAVHAGRTHCTQRQTLEIETRRGGLVPTLTSINEAKSRRFARLFNEDFQTIDQIYFFLSRLPQQQRRASVVRCTAYNASQVCFSSRRFNEVCFSSRHPMRCVFFHSISLSGERNAFILFAVSNGYKDEPIIGVDGKPLSRRTTAIHRAAMNKCSEFIIRELFKIYSRFDVNYVDEFGFTHLHVVCGYGLDYHVTKFLELGQDPNCIERLTGNSPLHVALTSTAERIEVVRWLLENGADPFLANKDGSTPLHIVCKKKQAYLSILEMFFRICDDKRQKEKFDALDILGRTPLHCACCSGNESAVESLLRRGANPYLADMNGWTPLHIICDNICTYPNLAPIFFKIIDEKQMIVKNKKTTPLKLALRQEHAKIESLLKKSVIVKRNSADGNELTHAQVINKRHRENDLVRTIFEFSVDENLLACINAQNKDGDTPLHLALRRRSNWAAEWLLQNGANPNLADTEGRNSLHAICQPSKKSREEDDDQVDLVKTIFERCHKKYQPLRVDAQDELGRTPLQWAVSSLLPNVVGVLLDNGADLSGFAFPTEAYFATKFDKSMVFKFRSASGALAIVERLESKGYELNLSEALTILKFFHRLELFQVQSRDQNCVRCSSECVSVARNPASWTRAADITVGGNTSFSGFSSLEYFDHYYTVPWARSFMTRLLGPRRAKLNFSADENEAPTRDDNFSHPGTKMDESEKNPQEIVSEDNLGEHDVVVSDDEKYVCDICQEAFTQESSMIAHRDTIHNDPNDFACDNCAKKFAKKSSLFTHQKLVHKHREDFSCHKCQKKFENKSSLLKHKRIFHEVFNNYLCNNCGKRFRNKNSLLLHIKNLHEGRKDFACDKCEDKFVYQSHLNRHQMIVHKGRKEFACDKCEEKFPYQSHLNRHQMVVHKGRKDFACDKCEEKFVYQSNLNRHQMIVHKDRKDFACDRCELKFERKRLLIRHQKEIHESRIVYAPKQSNPSDSSSHQEMVYESHENFSCKICGKKFRYRNDLTRHMNWVHEGRDDTVCDQCDKKFSFRGNLIRHQRVTHEGRRDFECDMCGKKFGYKKSLQQHQATAHERRRDYVNDNYESRFGQNQQSLTYQKTLHEDPKDNIFENVGKTFVDQRHLIKRQKISHENRQDDVCGSFEETIVILSGLITHQETAQERKKDDADNNESKFEQKQQSLTLHETLHEGNKDNICENVGVTFEAQSNLIINQETIQVGPKNDVCDNNESKFEQKQQSFTPHETLNEGPIDNICENVGETFEAQSNLITHQETAQEGHEDDVFNNCENKIEKTQQLLTTQETAQENHEDYVYDNCENEIKQSQQLFIHQETAQESHEDDVIDNVEKNLEQTQQLLSPQKSVHKKVKHYLSDDSGEILEDPSSLTKHQRIVHEGLKETDKDHLCDNPGEKFEVPSSSLAHQETAQEIHEDDVFDNCENKIEKTQQLLSPQETAQDNHEDYVYDNRENEIEQNQQLQLLSPHESVHEGLKEYSCENFTETYENISSSSRHQETAHESKKDFLCDDCGQIFEDQSNLTKHQKIVHDDEIHYLCDNSGETFDDQRSSIERQKLSLESSKNFSCDNCGQTFEDQSNFTKHRTTAHEGGKDYSLWEICGEIFEDPSSLTKHHKISHEDGNDCLLCENCGETFEDLNSLTNHQKTIHEGQEQQLLTHQEIVQENHEDDLLCEICGETFKDLSTLTRHQETTHESSRDYLCENCGETFEDLSSLIGHQKIIHEGGKHYLCDDSEETFEDQRSSIKRQKITHESSKVFLCDNCGRIFEDQSSLTKHQTTAHAGDEDYSFEKCGETLEDRSSFTRHQETAHVASKHHVYVNCENTIVQKQHFLIPQKPIHEEVKAYLCDNTGETFEDRSSLIKHQKISHENSKDSLRDNAGETFEDRSSSTSFQKTAYESSKNYACDMCTKKFGTKGYLLVHQRSIHEGRKDYACDKCDKRFGQKSGLQYHKKTVHEGDYACEKCQKVFGYKCYLLSHMRTAHEGRKDYECDKCEHKFKHRSDLYKHQRTVHDGRKDFACNKCDKTFGQRGNLKLHIKKVHEGH